MCITSSLNIEESLSDRKLSTALTGRWFNINYSERAFHLDAGVKRDKSGYRGRRQTRDIRYVVR
jgi:hypothetical protein